MRHAERKAAWRPLPYVTLMAVACFVLYFLVVAWHGEHLAHRFETEPLIETKGMVEELSKSSTKHGYNYYLEYQYRDSAGNPHHRRTGISQTYWQSLQPDDSISIEYLRLSPEHSRLAHAAIGRMTSFQLFMPALVVIAVIVGLITRNRSSSRNRHVHLPLPEMPPTGETRLYRAYFRQHWPISLICFVIGMGLLLFIIYLPDTGPSDDSFINHFFAVAAGVLLVITPLILRFGFYVRIDSEGLEARGLGPMKRVRWMEMTDVWGMAQGKYSNAITMADFAGPKGGLSINFKLFDRDCKKEIGDRIERYYGVSAPW